MSVRRVKAGTTDVSVVLRIVDSTDGTPETGVVFNTAGIDLWYRRELAASVDIVEATLAALTTAHADGGFLHINDGWYRLDLPDAACAAGVAGVQIGGTVTGMVVYGPYVELPVNTEEDIYTRVGAPAGASVSADVAAVKVDTAATLADTGTDGVVVAAASKTGYSLTATTGLGNQTADLTGSLSGSVGSVTGAVGSVTGAVGSVTGAVGSVTGAVGSVTGAVGSVTGNVGGNVVGSVGSVAGAVASVTGNVGGNVVGSVASVTAGVTVTTNNDKTGYSIAAGGIGSGAHAAAELNAIADAQLDRNMATGTDSGSDSTVTRTVRQALRRLRNKESIGAGTLTVTKEDDTTASWTAAVTTTAGDPLSAVDPT